MAQAEGGCLCSQVRYAVTKDPARIHICHCRFCQRASGAPYLIEAIFDAADFALTSGEPRAYEHASAGSGKTVFVHFCGTCGTKLYLTFERIPGVVGIYGGTFDDPNWFEIRPDNARHIFVGAARHGTIIPPHFNTFTGHFATYEGVPNEPKVFHEPWTVGEDPQEG